MTRDTKLIPFRRASRRETLRLLGLAGATLALPGLPGPSTPAARRSGSLRSDGMKIRLRIEGQETVITATLLDNDTARDFLSLLPLTLTLEDYAATEKISYLPRRLSPAGAPPGSDPAVGDLAYYAPWGNLAIFYKDAGYANGLVLLGTIDSGMDALSVPGSMNATIEPDTEPQ